MAIEVQASERLRDADFRALEKLRDLVGDAFVGGIVVHLGEYSFTSSDRAYAVPLDRLWLA